MYTMQPKFSFIWFLDFKVRLFTGTAPTEERGDIENNLDNGATPRAGYSLLRITREQLACIQKNGGGQLPTISSDSHPCYVVQ